MEFGRIGRQQLLIRTLPGNFSITLGKGVQKPVRAGKGEVR
jgi:hypothetical protein